MVLLAIPPRQLGEHRADDRVDIDGGAHESGNPITLHRPGVSRPSISWSRALSLVTSTVSPRLAPIRSNTRIGSPSAPPDIVSSCTTSNRSPLKVGCLTVEIAVPSTR